MLWTILINLLFFTERKTHLTGAYRPKKVDMSIMYIRLENVSLKIVKPVFSRSHSLFQLIYLA